MQRHSVTPRPTPYRLLQESSWIRLIQILGHRGKRRPARAEEELRRQLRDHHQRWRKGSAAAARIAPLPAHTPSLTPATLPRYQQMSADGAEQLSAGGKVQEPPKPDSRLTDVERALLHRQLRQVAREQALSRDRETGN